MSKKLAKYIITTGVFENETNNIKIARKQLKKHAAKMKQLYDDEDIYGIYTLVEKNE